MFCENSQKKSLYLIFKIHQFNYELAIKWKHKFIKMTLLIPIINTLV